MLAVQPSGDGLQIIINVVGTEFEKLYIECVCVCVFRELIEVS